MLAVRPDTRMPAYQDRLSWYLGAAAYWFIGSAKYFILLLTVLPGQVRDLTPEGTQNAQWGLVVTIGSTWAIFGPAIFGYLSDLVGRRRPFIALGAGLTLVAFAVLGNASQLWMILVGYLLLQVSDDMGQGAYQAVIPEHVPEERRGRASGVMAFMELIAQITIALIAKALGDVQMIYIALGVINVLCALWTLYTLRGTRKIKEVSAVRAPGSLASFFRGWLSPWRSRDFAWVWLTRFLSAVGFYCAQLYLRFYLEDRVGSFTFFGLNAGNADSGVIYLGLTISVFGGIGAIWSARVADRIGRKRVIYVSGTTMSLILVPYALIPNYQLFFLLSMLFGLAYGAYLGANWALVSDILPSRDSIAMDMGIWAATIPLGQAVAGSAGRLVDAFNRSSPGMGYSVVFLIGAAMFFGGTVFVRMVKGST